MHKEHNQAQCHFNFHILFAYFTRMSDIKTYKRHIVHTAWMVVPVDVKLQAVLT